jgi:hypothetical protein
VLTRKSKFLMCFDVLDVFDLSHLQAIGVLTRKSKFLDPAAVAFDVFDLKQDKVCCACTFIYFDVFDVFDVFDLKQGKFNCACNTLYFDLFDVFDVFDVFDLKQKKVCCACNTFYFLVLP